LRELIIKGFVLDDERLKLGNTLFGKDYFADLLERIREIRASERRFYQKVADMYALAVDYDAGAPITRELIYITADATKLITLRATGFAGVSPRPIRLAPRTRIASDSVCRSQTGNLDKAHRSPAPEDPRFRRKVQIVGQCTASGDRR
jgi:hypothetical protein